MSDTSIGGSGPPVPPEEHQAEERTSVGMFPIQLGPRTVVRHAGRSAQVVGDLLLHRLAALELVARSVTVGPTILRPDARHVHMILKGSPSFAPVLLKLVTQVVIDGVPYPRMRDTHDSCVWRAGTKTYAVGLTISVDVEAELPLALPQEIDLRFDPELAHQEKDLRPLHELRCPSCLLLQVNRGIAEAVWWEDGTLRVYFQTDERIPDVCFLKVTAVQLGKDRVSVLFLEHQQCLPKARKDVTAYAVFRTNEQPENAKIFVPRDGTVVKLLDWS